MDIMITYLKQSRLIILLKIYTHWYKSLTSNDNKVLAEKLKNKIAYYLLVLDFANQSATQKESILEEFLEEPFVANNVMQYIEHYEFDTIENVRYDCGYINDLKMSSAQNTLYSDRITKFVSNLIFSFNQNTSIDNLLSFKQESAASSYFVTVNDNETVNRINNSTIEAYEENIEKTKILHCVTKVIQYGKEPSILKYFSWIYYYSIYIQNKNSNSTSALPINLPESMPISVFDCLKKHVPESYCLNHNIHIYETANSTIILLTSVLAPTQRYIFYVENPSNFKFSTLHLITEDMEDVSSHVERLYVAVHFEDDTSVSNSIDWNEINQLIEYLFFIDQSLYMYPQKTLFCLNGYYHYDYHIDFSCMNAHRNLTIENWHKLYSPREVNLQIILPINPNILQLIIKRNMVKRLPMVLTLDLGGNIQGDNILMTDLYRIIAAVLIAYEANVCLFLQRQYGEINGTYGQTVPFFPLYKLSPNDNYKIIHLNKSFNSIGSDEFDDKVIRLEKIDNQLIVHCVEQINECLNNTNKLSNYHHVHSTNNINNNNQVQAWEYNYLNEYIVSNPCNDNVIELLFSGSKLAIEKTEFIRESKYYMYFRDSMVFFEQPVLFVDELAVIKPYAQQISKLNTFRSLNFIHDLFSQLSVSVTKKINICHEFSLFCFELELVFLNSTIFKINPKLFNNVSFWALVTTDGSNNTYSINAEHESIISEYIIGEKILNSGTSSLLETLIRKRLSDN